jgi:xylulokinase
LRWVTAGPLPAILWNDNRGQSQAEAIEQELRIGRLVELGGNRVLAGFTAPKLAWLADTCSATLRRNAGT